MLIERWGPLIDPDPYLQPEPQVRYAAAQLPLQMGDPPLPAPAGP